MGKRRGIEVDDSRDAGGHQRWGHLSRFAEIQARDRNRGALADALHVPPSRDHRDRLKRGAFFLLRRRNHFVPQTATVKGEKRAHWDYTMLPASAGPGSRGLRARRGAASHVGLVRAKRRVLAVVGQVRPRPVWSAVSSALGTGTTRNWSRASCESRAVRRLEG